MTRSSYIITSEDSKGFFYVISDKEGKIVAFDAEKGAMGWCNKLGKRHVKAFKLAITLIKSHKKLMRSIPFPNAELFRLVSGPNIVYGVRITPKGWSILRSESRDV